MNRMTKAALLVGVGALVLAAPAAADTSDFDAYVAEEIPFVVQQYGATAVRAEGMAICQMEAQGVTGTSNVVDRVVAQMPMSRAAAISLKVGANFHLGC